MFQASAWCIINVGLLACSSQKNMPSLLSASHVCWMFNIGQQRWWHVIISSARTFMSDSWFDLLTKKCVFWWLDWCIQNCIPKSIYPSWCYDDWLRPWCLRYDTSEKQSIYILTRIAYVSSSPAYLALVLDAF